MTTSNPVRPNKWGFAPLPMLLCLAAGFLSNPASSQTFSESAELALRIDPARQALLFDLDRATESQVQARALRKSRIDFEISTGPRQLIERSAAADNVGANFGLETQFAVVASQPVWLAGRARAAGQISDAQSAIIRARISHRTTELLLELAEAYCDLRLSLAQAQALERSREGLTAHLEENKSRFREGVLTRTDVETVEAQIAEVGAQTQSVRGREAIARYRVETLTGLVLTETPRKLPVPFGPDTFLAALELAGSSSPEVAIAVAEADLADAELSFVSADGRGRSDLRAKVAGGTGSGINSADTVEFGVSLQFVFPLYSAGVTSSRQRGAVAQVQSANSRVDARRREAQRRVSEAWIRRESLKSAYELNVRQIAASEEGLRGMLLERNEGLRTTQDVLMQEQAVLSARLLAAQVERDLIVASFTVLATTGLLTPELAGVTDMGPKVKPF